MSKIKGKKHTVRNLVIGAAILGVIGTVTFANKDKNENEEYIYYSDILDENPDNTYMDELFSEGVTINLDGEDIALKTAVDKMDASNRIYEILKEYIEESNDTQENEITDDEKQQYIDEYKNSGVQDVEYINGLIEDYEATEDGFEKARIIRKLVCLEDYLSEYSDKYGTQILDTLSELMLDTAATQAYGFEDPNSYKDYTFDSEYESGTFKGKVTMKIIDDELSGHAEEEVFNGDILGGAGAYVELYKDKKSMDSASENGRSSDIMRECYANVLESAKAALEVNPEKAKQKILDYVPFVGK